MPTLHMIHGFVGVGKTTFAKRLAQQTGGIRFSPDEWMVRLHGQNPPAADYARHHDGIVSLMWDVAVPILKTGNDVILDYGFWQRAERDDYRQRAQAIPASVILYNVRCPDEVARERTLRRTNETPSALFIDENALREFRNHFEPLAADEDTKVVVSQL